MPWSSPGHQLCSFSLPQVRDWLKQLLIGNSQPLGVDREELVCIFGVIHLSGTFPPWDFWPSFSDWGKNVATCLSGKHVVQRIRASDTKTTLVFQLCCSICYREQINCLQFGFKWNREYSSIVGYLVRFAWHLRCMWDHFSWLEVLSYISYRGEIYKLQLHAFLFILQSSWKINLKGAMTWSLGNMTQWPKEAFIESQKGHMWCKAEFHNPRY